MTTQSIEKLFDLSGKGAIVTGGGMGIGQGITFRLSEAGAGVMVVDIDLQAAKQTSEQIIARGGVSQAIHADVGTPGEAEKVVRATVEAFGRVDILVNNAAVCFLTPALDTTEESWDKVLNVNLKGLFFFSKAAAQEMIDTGHGGKIINIASIDSLHPTGNLTHYDASKGGVVMVTKALALELAPHNILVNAIAPGGIVTPMAKSFFSHSGKDPEKIMKGVTGRIPLGHWGEPDDIAKVVLFLASAAADYVTGTLLVVDGGYLLS
jgi:2-deoxy-D-gluconate 3-dehydrogenase